ncbi:MULTISPECIES: aromatic acid exporter family protein [unclassified Microbacterium]|jgi:uncharacterized membrane protein YccC|uniref:FUSC family protein n=1 Tax=unclassified Microbacterium TaxID=2609290 RepID=UPI000C2BD6C0|nr:MULTISPECIES: FUSC family protein [unclassified Microbacterium]
MRVTSAIRAPHRVPLLQVAKSAIATVGAWLIADAIVQGPPPVFAAIAALLVVQPSLNQSFSKAIERSVGVIVGVVIASVLGIAFGEDTWVILVSIVVALIVAWLARATAGTANQVAISALLVLSLGAATPGYAFDRVLETVIGAAIGIIVNVILVPPVAVAPAHRAVDALGEEVAASLERLAAALENPPSPAGMPRAGVEELLLTARLMRPMRDAAEKAIIAGRDSLTLNPRARRHRDELAALSTVLDRLGPIVTQVIGMTRAFSDHYDPTIAEEPTVRAIADQLRRAAHDVRLELRVGTDAGAPDVTGEGMVPALTAPLAITMPSPDHWILIGSLLEDLQRIHATLSRAA